MYKEKLTAFPNFFLTPNLQVCVLCVKYLHNLLYFRLYFIYLLGDCLTKYAYVLCRKEFKVM